MNEILFEQVKVKVTSIINHNIHFQDEEFGNSGKVTMMDFDAAQAIHQLYALITAQVKAAEERERERIIEWLKSQWNGTQWEGYNIVAIKKDDWQALSEVKKEDGHG